MLKLDWGDAQVWMDIATTLYMRNAPARRTTAYPRANELNGRSATQGCVVALLRLRQSSWRRIPRAPETVACPCKPRWSAMVSTESGSAVKLTGHRRQQTDDSDISFPPLESWNPLTKVATIAAQVGGKRVLCRISMEVLKKRFRASASEPMQSVSKNRELIRDAARKLIESNAYEENGSILIRQKDI